MWILTHCYIITLCYQALLKILFALYERVSGKTCLDFTLLSVSCTFLESKLIKDKMDEYLCLWMQLLESILVPAYIYFNYIVYYHSKMAYVCD